MVTRLFATIIATTLILPTGFTGPSCAQKADTALPSPAGPTVSAITKMAPGSWLDLGPPRADPKWGRARGRAWTSKMAFSGALGGAFLFGEGVHGWADPVNGRYMDGLWFYDVNAHRWVTMHPGTDTRSPPKLVVTSDGFEGIAADRPIPIATMVHGYQMTAWDPVRQLFFSMPVSDTYYSNALPGVARFRSLNVSRLNWNRASPWIFDPWNRKWHRLKTPTPSPRSGYGNVLTYIPSKRRLFFYRPKQIHFYDPAENIWMGASPYGPLPPFGIDPTSCHDPKRDRVYIGGGAYPVTKGPNALWYYDVGANRWVDPRPDGSPGGNSYGTNVAVMTCEHRNGRVYLFRHRGGHRGLHVYDAELNQWRYKPLPLPEFWRKSGMVNGFYHPGLDVHFIHLADDSRDNGRIFVYRPAR